MRRPLGAAAAGLLGAACLAAGCAPPLIKLPAGPGAPVAAADARAALAQATAACAAVQTLTAEIAVSGSAGGRRLRGRLSAGVAAPASVRLEAVAPFGEPLFIFVATGNDATLLLPRDARVLEHGRPDIVLDAVAGVPLDAADLFTTLTGCAPPFAPSSGRDFGVGWRVVHVSAGAASYDLYLQRDGAATPWRLVSMVRIGQTAAVWHAEYRDFQDGRPRSIRLLGDGIGSPRGRTGFDLRLALTQVDVNSALDARVFAVSVPRDAEPITLEELRQSGPLASLSHAR
jgi:hypothetical protein